MVTIRRADPTDAAKIFPLARDFAISFRPEPKVFELAFFSLINQEDALVLVAEESQQLLGYLLGFDHVTFFANGRVSWVEEIAVHEDHRRKRIGEALMLRFEDWARSQESKLVALGTRRAAAFYRDIGYEESAIYFRKLL